MLTEEGFTSVPGVAGEKGEIIFSNVPPGVRYLRHGGERSRVYTVTNENLVDLSTIALGRAGAQLELRHRALAIRLRRAGR